eukprot:g43464.t1
MNQWMKTYRELTSKCGKEAFKVTTSWSEDEIAIHCGDDGGSESTKDHEEIRNSQVEEDIVKGLPKFLVLDGDVQGEEIDGEPCYNEEEHHSQFFGEYKGIVLVSIVLNGTIGISETGL